MRRLAVGLLLVGLVISGCAAQNVRTATPKLVSDVDIERALLDKDQINAVMGTSSMVAQPMTTAPGDNRNLVSNLNCLGVWQAGESAIYGPAGAEGGWSVMRQQKLRTPDTDDWDSLAVQSVVAYPTPDAARAFLEESAVRWSQCTNHTINITLNDRPLPKWLSGELTRTETRLAMPFARGVGRETKQCQHVLDAAANVILDVVTCKPRNEGASEAGELADAMRSNLAG